MRIMKFVIGTISLLLALKEEFEMIRFHKEGKNEDSIFAGQMATIYICDWIRDDKLSMRYVERVNDGQRA